MPKIRKSRFLKPSEADHDAEQLKKEEKKNLSSYTIYTF
jgi:hypothetical protein